MLQKMTVSHASQAEVVNSVHSSGMVKPCPVQQGSQDVIITLVTLPKIQLCISYLCPTAGLM